MSAWFLLAAAVCADGLPNGWRAVPGDTNALAIVDVAKLRASGAAGAQALEVVSAELTPDTKSLTVVANFNLATFQSVWEIGIAEIDGRPSAADLARSEHGYVDRIGKRDVVWSPRNLYLAPLDGDRLAVISPANRQTVSKWARAIDAGEGGELPPYLAQTAARAKSPVVVAIDLHDVVAPHGLAKRLGQLNSTKGQDLDKLAETMVGLEGVALALKVDGPAMQGLLHIRFAKPPEALAGIGSALTAEILERRGVALPGMADWAGSVVGNEYVMTGKMAPLSVAYLLGLLGTPASVGTAKSAASAPASNPAAASKRYFDGVAKNVKSYRDYEAPSNGCRAEMGSQVARRIDRLPMLDVDADLLNWGNTVAELLRGSALTIRNANIDAGAARGENLASAVTSSWWDFNSNALGNNYAVNAQANAQGAKSYRQTLDQIEASMAKVRRAMTERFRIEF